MVEGVVKRGAKVRLLRDNIVIHEGTLKTLKRVKDEVKEVREGFECGMAFENYDNIEAGDLIECFEMEEIAGRCKVISTQSSLASSTSIMGIPSRMGKARPALSLMSSCVVAS